MDKPASKVSSESLRTRLKLKSLETKAIFSKKHPHADKFFKFKGLDLGKVREHSAKLISSGALVGSLLLAPPIDLKSLPSPQEIIGKLKMKDANEVEASAPQVNKKEVLTDSLKVNLPEKPRPLSREEEKNLEQTFTNLTGVDVRATLEGEHLNTTFGYIGAEQHLRRYPGDSLSHHGDSDIRQAGMAPGLGAWGYFANSKKEMNKDLEDKEKWYAVVQTLYLADWNRRQPFLKEWYKYRKVLIINTQNGNAVIASIADSGPAAWTGKQFGGSPEVMQYLGGPKYKKGSVVVFFVDDPGNKVSLGPVEY